MRKLAIAMALASTGLATPAVARDHSPYVGVEGGIMWVEDADVDVDDGVTRLNSAVTITHKSGFDVDLIAGYDFGMLRLEGELAYKRASVNQVRVDPRISGGGPGDNFDADGRGRALSGMVNLLLDFGNDDGLSGYAGVGVGLKYRFFNVPNLKFAASGVQGSVIDLDGRWRSHSLLASLIYNFYSPAP